MVLLGYFQPGTGGPEGHQGLDGLWVGVQNRVTLFEDHTGAQLAVVAPGTDSLFADASSLPSATVREVAGTSGVRWASGVRTMFNILELHDAKTAVALVGADPGRPRPDEPLPPRAVAADGSAPRANTSWRSRSGRPLSTTTPAPDCSTSRAVPPNWETAATTGRPQRIGCRAP